MKYQRNEKLRGADSWTIWKFAIKNLLRAFDGGYEICIVELHKPILIQGAVSLEQSKEYQNELKCHVISSSL